MNIYNSFFKNTYLIKKIKKFILKKILKGHYILKKEGKANLVYDIRLAISEEKINLENNNFSKYIFSDVYNNREIIVRHYIIYLLTFRYFDYWVMFFTGIKKKIIFPMPLNLLKIATEKKLQINYFFSVIAWRLVCILFFLKAQYKLILVIYNYLNFKLKKKFPKNYIYFFSLTDYFSVFTIKNSKYKNILTWYINWKGGVKNFTHLCHSNKSLPRQQLEKNKQSLYIASPIPRLMSLNILLKFLQWFIISNIIIIFDLLRGKGLQNLIFCDLMDAKIIELDNGKSLAKEYLFNNSMLRSRPAWTYNAEKLDSKITFYFYSTNNIGYKNNEVFFHKKINKKNANVYYGLRSLNWSRYLVWDKYQANWLKKFVNESKIQIVGSIPFVGGKPIPDSLVSDKYLAVFTIEPLRYYRYIVENHEFFQYLTIEICKKFIDDIVLLSKKLNIKIILKHKRKKPYGIEHAGYINYCKNLALKKSLILMDEGYSAASLIENSMGVISFPWTSTGQFAESLNKSNVFYDCTNTLYVDDPAAHELLVLKTINDLEKWIKNLLLDKNNETQ